MKSLTNSLKHSKQAQAFIKIISHKGTLCISGFIYGAGVFAFLLGALSFGSKTYIIPSGSIGLALSILAFSLLVTSKLLTSSQKLDGTSLDQYSPRQYNNPKKSNAALTHFISGALASSLLLYNSNWKNIPFSFISDPYLAHTALLSVVFFFILSPFITSNLCKVLSTTAILCLLFLFFRETNALPVYTDDHGSVTYRLSLLKDHLFSIPLYNTDWNAGTDWRDFFATGILNVFLIFYPLIVFTKTIDSAYVLIVPSILFIITPFSAFAASKVLRLSNTTAVISSILAITANITWYKWGLTYGSMGFVCSTALFPLFFALAIRTLEEREETPALIILSVFITASLCIFWSAQGLSMIPLILYALLKIKTLVYSKKIRVLAIGLVLFNLPWIILFLNISKVGNFVSVEKDAKPNTQQIVENAALPTDTLLQEASPKKQSNIKEKHSPAVVKGKKQDISKKNFLKTFRENVTKIHPLIYLLCIPALLYLPLKKSYRFAYATSSLWLFILGTVVVHIKPQLELDRMLVILSLLLTVPVAECISTFLKLEDKNHRYSISKAILVSLLFLGFFSVSSVIQKKSWVSYHTRSPLFNELGNMISEHAGQGRTLFSGFVLHDFEGSHIAPLPLLSKKPIMASSPVHNLWWYTDIIPEFYRKKGPAGIEEYLDIYNVSMTIAHERVWKAYFRESSFKYKEVGTVGRFVVFQRLSSPDTYFYKGSGSLIEQNAKHIVVNDLSIDAVLRFNYFPFLEVDNCKSIEPYKVSESITFISLHSCETNRKITIKSAPWYKRLW